MKGASASQKRTARGLLLLRFLVGWVFLSEGIQKFLFPAALGAGRFAKIGLPVPQFTGPYRWKKRKRRRWIQFRGRRPQ
jgi:uncharacterized membrane protein YphA (DoxX/SURF4 family)